MRRSTFEKLMPPGSTLEVSYVGTGAYTGNVDAPGGMIWQANYEHSLVLSGNCRKDLAADLRDAAERMSYGIESCKLSNCYICAEARGEVA